MRRRNLLMLIGVGIILLFLLCLTKNSSPLPEIYPTCEVVIVEQQVETRHHKHKNEMTEDVRLAHQKRLFAEINMLTKRTPLKWKDFLTHKILPLLETAPCFCSPCGKISQSERTCDEVQSHKTNNLSGMVRSAVDLDLQFPFQQLPSSSNLFGGAWKPNQCLSTQKIAIIIPFRNRWRQLNTLLQVLHPFLQRQSICYRIFVVEQYGNAPFNKGRLNNAGFLEATKWFRFDCVIFHDTDLIPFSYRNRYKCPDKRPIHMVTGLNTTKFKLPYKALVGGVIAFSVEQYVRLNGYSNLYWGWGLEDDDMELRMKKGPKFKYTRPKAREGYYMAQKHLSQGIFLIQGARRRPLLSTSIRRYRFDGLNSVEYKVIAENVESAYTHILVHVGNEPVDFVGMENDT